MRKLFIGLGILIAFSTIHAQEVVEEYESSAYSSFYKDSTYFILGDVVNVRLNPDAGGKVIYKLSIGEKIRILEDTKLSYTLNGYTANWFRVVYKHNGDKGEGYIWGGMIATQTIESATEKGLYFMYGVDSVETREYGEKVRIIVKVIKENKKLSSISIPAEGGLFTYTIAENTDGKGLEGVKNIIKINFSDGYCGGVLADAYFFWDGNSISHPVTLSEWFDAPYYVENILIFPTDDGGNKKGYIINKFESGYYNDNSKNKITEKRNTLYEWNGNEMVEIVRKKKK